MIIDRYNPFFAKIKERSLLTKPGSTKKTFHLVLDLKGAELVFKPGDSIGVFAHNDLLLVERFLQAMGKTGKEGVICPRTQESISLLEFLSKRANLAKLTSGFIKLVKEISPHEKKLEGLLENREHLLGYCRQNDPLDFLEEFSHLSFPLDRLVAQFSPLLPRFYSVASSLKTYPGEVHLTVALTSFLHKGDVRYGVASHFLCNLATFSTEVPIYVQPTPHFILPEEGRAPIIMVGPGTGVAPFRAFMQERRSTNAKGKNWLFFGERNRHLDFFYEDFWHDLCSQNKLRLDTAFSRDQKEKVYVQHKMIERGQLLWEWLQEGAYFYVCGEADPMAKEVEAALLHIIQQQGSLTEESAKNYIRGLRHEKRYLSDVY